MAVEPGLNTICFNGFPCLHGDTIVCNTIIVKPIIVFFYQIMGENKNKIILVPCGKNYFVARNNFYADIAKIISAKNTPYMAKNGQFLFNNFIFNTAK